MNYEKVFQGTSTLRKADFFEEVERERTFTFYGPTVGSLADELVETSVEIWELAYEWLADREDPDETMMDNDWTVLTILPTVQGVDVELLSHVFDPERIVFTAVIEREVMLEKHLESHLLKFNRRDAAELQAMYDELKEVHEKSEIALSDSIADIRAYGVSGAQYDEMLETHARTRKSPISRILSSVMSLTSKG